MVSSHISCTHEASEDTGPVPRDGNPFDDDAVTTVLDDAWDDIQS